jgi:hypothetical protein
MDRDLGRNLESVMGLTDRNGCHAVRKLVGYHGLVRHPETAGEAGLTPRGLLGATVPQ